MVLGIDVSSYEEVLSSGVKFFDHGKECDPIKELAKQGCDIARIRVWLDPYDSKGKPYYGGTSDRAHFFSHAKMMMKYGYGIMVDFHYSDYWADPSKQIPPKAWAHKSIDELQRSVYDYTKEFLLECVKEKIDVKYIQIGNEITNGMLFPTGALLEWSHGGKHNYGNFISYLKAASKACREVIPEAGIIVHVERTAYTEWITEFFTRLNEARLDYDIIGCSYYPFWHGGFKDFEASLCNLKHFCPRVMIVETGYGFTDTPYFLKPAKPKEIEEARQGYIKYFATPLEVPLTPEGQCEFIERIFDLAEKYELEGVCYWEPLWCSGKDGYPQNPNAYKYVGEKYHYSKSVMANTCLFDYDWEKLPAFSHFKKRK